MLLLFQIKVKIGFKNLYVNFFRLYNKKNQMQTQSFDFFIIIFIKTAYYTFLCMFIPLFQ